MSAKPHCIFLVLLSIAIVGPSALLLRAQEQADPRTLVLPELLTALASEVSGTQALGHVLEMTPVERDRPADEYGSATYREAAYMAARAREYGFSDVKIERFPQSSLQWDGEMGELWIEEPVRRLVTRYSDVTATLAPGSRTSDVTAELVFVGRGDREGDYANKDVDGKIVLVSGPVGAAHNLAVRRFGAAGVASFFNGSGKPIDRPDQIAWGTLRDSLLETRTDGDLKTTFGFVLSHRMGMELVDLIERSNRVVTRAKVRASEHPADLQVVVATIPGDESIPAARKPELLFVAHLFEGIAKQGANDNASGPAVQLELGRAWIKLVREGVLPRPRRTVRFLWVPEISGTRAYLQRYPDLPARALAAINMDMVGADQSKHANSLNVVLTPYSLPSFLNDITTQFMEFVGDTNRAKVHNRASSYGFRNPIVDPTGSRDPFRYHVEKFAMGSDHQVFLDTSPRVPSVAFNNFHDFSYHTSEDAPALLDPTQMKRMAFIGLAMGHLLAGATPMDGISIAALSVAYAERRLGEDLVSATMMIASASTADAVHAAFKDAVNLMRWAHWRERSQVRSAAVLIGTDQSHLAQLARIEEAFASGEPIDLRRVAAAYAARSAGLGVRPIIESSISVDEQAAAKLIPRRRDQSASQLSASAGQVPPLSGAVALEARQFADGSRSILDVRNALSAEFGPIPLESVIAFFRNLEKAGTWVIEEEARKPVDN